ncbi:MAG: bifunctional nuclease family protein [Muribaculaceae bacterium]|nr:bifunctional nuclease family protein [Muribaculaceae bacterium]
MEKRYKLDLVGITYNQIETGVYALILQESEGERRIPIVIGFPEAQAIQCKLQEVAIPRPLTHDTMVNTLSAFGIDLVEVEIKRLPNGVFSADLIFSNGITEQVIDSRSSDAVALAIRVGAPIYTTESVLAEAGFYNEENRQKASSPSVSNPKSREKKSANLESLSLEKLKAAMTKAAENEDYEEAARIKSEIDRRNNKSNT